MTAAPPFRTPDLYRPWPPRLNPHLDAARAHTRAWAAEQGVTGAAVWDGAALEAIDLALLAAYCYPDADRPALELITDWFVWGFFLDDWFLRVFKDGRDTAGAAAWLDRTRRFMPADPAGPVPEPGDPVQRALHDLWARTVPRTSAGWRSRFAADTLAQITDALWELDNLSARRIPNPIDYLEHKRGVGAGRFAADLVELAMGLDLPDRVVASRPVQVLRDAFTDAQVLLNDLLSYERETREEGELHNFVLILERFLGVDAQRAADTAADLHASRLQRFEDAAAAELPALMDELGLDARTRRDLLTLARCLQDADAGSHEWHLRSPRYANAATRDRDPRTPVWQGPSGLGTAAARRWAAHRPVLRLPRTFQDPGAPPAGPARVNPHIAAVRSDLAVWSARTGLLDGTVWDPATFAAADHGGRAAMTHPDAPAARLRTVARWGVVLAHLDDLLDRAFKPRGDLAGARAFLARLPAFLADGPPPPGCAAERALAEVWRDVAAGLGDAARARLAADFGAFLDGCAWEMEGAARQRVPDAVDYLEMRRRTGATAIACDLLGYALDLDAAVPPALLAAFSDQATIANDLRSHAKEVATPGETCNGVLVVQRLLGCGLQRAADVVADLGAARAGQFGRLAAEAVAAAPELAPLVDGLRAWLAGDRLWGARTHRYGTPVPRVPVPAGPGTSAARPFHPAPHSAPHPARHSRGPAWPRP
ncbi:terpene synthase family protein [Actinomadura parmotrematis]|uniref:Terpene synthase n=1 Tax=Actinomadura parmotrematis TaxID=2864039 RepID=A0ABS7FMM4_9ACTN|nr:hypothetical protein [Actinomadura parmotrematis]MBW8481245.1 hypothetical protein [Actinomadura parmotrematis]